MKVKISRATVVALIFTSVSMISVSYATIEAANYGSYWDARSELSSSVDSIHAQTNPANGTVTIRATVSATNPTDYSGMMVRYFELRLWFTKPALNQSLFSGDSTGEILDLVSNHNPPAGDLAGAHSTLRLTLTVQLSPSRSASFNSFLQPDPSQVYGQTDLRAVVDSFLDPVVGAEVVQNIQTVAIA